MSAAPGDHRPHVVVVGGGIAGLAAARALSRHGDAGVRVTVLEAAATVGGKLAVAEVGGVPVDTGAEAMLVRRPEGRDLAVGAGLGPDLVAPETTAATVWSRGALRPLPAGQVLGVPADLAAVRASGLLRPAELARARLEPLRPGRPLEGDTAVGPYVSRRLGRAVVDRLVEPLLGGVYAGAAEQLSMAATMPALWQAAIRHRSLLAAAAAARDAGAVAAGTPAFASLRGGLGRLPGALVRHLDPAGATEVRTEATVRALERTPTGWRVVLGPAVRPQAVDADGVVLAVPGPAAARLLTGHVPAAAELGTLRYASVAIVTLALPAVRLPPGSGFLVPPVEGRLVKAATFSSAKWGWYGRGHPGTVVVRMSVGRHGEERDLQRDDADLVAAARTDLRDLAGVGAAPLDARVTRWGGALPQYAVGHLDLVARLREQVAALPGLAVCGAAYDGVGVPACAASGWRAAADVLARLAPAVGAAAAREE